MKRTFESEPLSIARPAFLINLMNGIRSHGTFRKRSGGLQSLISFRLMVSVFGSVILFSLIVVAMVLKQVRDENIAIRRMVLGEQRNLVLVIEEKLSALEGRAGRLEARVSEAETKGVNASPEEGAQIPIDTLRSLIRLLWQHQAGSAEVDALMQQLPEEARNALADELEAANPGRGHNEYEDAEENSHPLATPDPPTSSDSQSYDEGGPVSAEEGNPSAESFEEKPIPARFVEYEVQVGDTLSAIALLYRAPVTAILELNKIDDPNQIRVGSVLRIPSSVKAPQG